MNKNKYSKWYYNIVNRAQSRTLLPNVRVEKHHILPRSLGGSNDTSNIAILTLREHFICHALLVKMTENKDRNKMVYALWKMCHSSKSKISAFKLNSRKYDSVKSLMSTVRTSEDFTPEWRAKISVSRKGKSSWNKGVARTSEEKSKMSATRKQRALDPNWNIRPACSTEKAQKIKEANLGKKWAHNKETKNENMFRPMTLFYYAPKDGVLV